MWEETYFSTKVVSPNVGDLASLVCVPLRGPGIIVVVVKNVRSLGSTFQRTLLTISPSTLVVFT